MFHLRLSGVRAPVWRLLGAAALTQSLSDSTSLIFAKGGARFEILELTKHCLKMDLKICPPPITSGSTFH